ncbi:MAG: AgmX/PglI C-terminal domain-containing protein [Kofleriaceae bacterium]
MRGSLGIGLVIGLVVGSGAMYLALRPPWGHGGTTPPSDAGGIAVVTPDAGAGKPKKRSHHHRPSHNAGGTTSGDEQGWGSGDYVEETEPQLVQLTAADRALEWRGDNTSRPPQHIDMTGGAEARSLDDGEIRSTIDAQSAGAQHCVVQGATNTNLTGTVTVKLIVDGNGHVTKSKVEAFHYMFEHGLLACVQREVGRMKFPATGASTLVTMPINLT